MYAAKLLLTVDMLTVYLVGRDFGHEETRSGDGGGGGQA